MNSWLEETQVLSLISKILRMLDNRSVDISEVNIYGSDSGLMLNK